MRARTEPAVARVRAAAGRLLNRVEHWTQPRWALPGRDSGAARDAGVTRADLVHALVQRLADLTAGVENREPLAVPRLSNDLALPDQVRVMVADLTRSGAPDDIMRAAATAIDATAARL